MNHIFERVPLMFTLALENAKNAPIICSLVERDRLAPKTNLLRN